MAQEKKRSSFRDSYFQDHARKIVLGADGNPHVEYVYEGIYYTLGDTDRRWFLRKLGCFAMSAASAGLLLSAMMTDTALNRMADILILQVLALFSFLGLGVGVVNRLTAPRRMTKWEYRMGVVTLKECSLLLVLILGCMLADGVLSVLLGRIVWESTCAVALGKMLSCLLVVLVQYRLVRTEAYRQEISEDLPSGIDITNDFGPLP